MSADRMALSGASAGEVETNLAKFSERLLAMGYAVIKVDDVFDDWTRQAIINESNEQNRRRREYGEYEHFKTNEDARIQRNIQGK